QRLEGLAGRIALSVACFGHQPGEEITPEEKARLDDLHLRKIDLADEVLVIDVRGYIGESTRREITYATERGKRLRYWSKERGACDETYAVANHDPAPTRAQEPAPEQVGEPWEPARRTTV